MIACVMRLSQIQIQSFLWKKWWVWYSLLHVVFSGGYPSGVDPVNALSSGLFGQELGVTVPRSLSICRFFRREPAVSLTLESTYLGRPGLCNADKASLNHTTWLQLSQPGQESWCTDMEEVLKPLWVYSAT